VALTPFTLADFAALALAGTAQHPLSYSLILSPSLKIGLWTKADSVTLFDAVIYGATR
jgi:hypothetical protein